MKLYELSAAQYPGHMRGISAREVFLSCLARARELEPQISAMLTITEESGMAQAKAVDEAVASGKKLPPLAGVPFVVKDNMCTKGIPTTCASKMLMQWKPPYNAAVIELLAEAGAVLMGKTNLDEFAMGGTTEHSVYGATSNPWKLDCVPGAVTEREAQLSVAARYVPFSLGSEQAGLFAKPAAFAVFMVSKTYGAGSRRGLAALLSPGHMVLAPQWRNLALSTHAISRK